MFTWEVSAGFTAGGPWIFYVERGITQNGPWTVLSPPLTNQYAWATTERLVAPKDPVLYFRVRMVTPDAKEYLSPVIMPYGTLDRREFLIVQEIMRKELLQMEQMAGVPITIWLKAIFGPVCDECRDFVTGDILKQDCPYCFGTGVKPGYHGPYCSWGTFSPIRRQKMMQPDQTTTQEPYSVQLRMLGVPRLKKDDVIVDSRADKRYYVDTIQNATEIRRIPVIQDIVANEIPTSSPLYKLEDSTLT